MDYTSLEAQISAVEERLHKLNQHKLNQHKDNKHKDNKHDENPKQNNKQNQAQVEAKQSISK